MDDVKDVPVNLAYGGNVFAIVPAARFGIKIQPSYMERIKHYSARIREVIAEKGIAVTLVQWYDEPKSKEADLRVVHSSEYLTEITGQARITGFHKFVFADNDDLREGFYFD